MRNECSEAAIQVFGQNADLLSIVSQRQLAPSVRNCFQEGNKAGRCGENNLLGEGRLDQIRVLIERRTQELVAGNETGSRTPGCW